MRVPLFSKNSRLTAVIPALSGGVDYQRSPWLIADNALSEGENVWWKDGALRTREGFYTTAYRRQQVQEGRYRFFTDRDGLVVSLETVDTASATTVFLRSVNNSGENGKTLYQMTLPAGGRACAVPAGGQYDDCTVLLLLSNGKMFGSCPSRNSGTTFSGTAYVPLLFIDGAPTVLLTDKRETGTRYEQANRLTGKFRCQYTADGKGLYYQLPKKPLTGEVMVDTTEADGTIDSFLIPADSDLSEPNANGLCVQVDRARGYVVFVQGKSAVLRAQSELPNDVCITATAVQTDTLTPYHMQFGTWYGAGGSRLFMAGHPDAPDKMIWSAPDDPTYFPEHNWASVGAPRTPITAFGKQDGALVIFKEREIYVAQYEANTAAKSGEPTAQFPLTPIHTEIGCDLPNTPALLGNRLVWACKDGSVYRLSAITAAGKGGITAVGAAVRPLLLTAPSVAYGQVCDGRYYLLWDTQLLTFSDDTVPIWYRHVWHDTAALPIALGCANNRLLIAAQQGTQRWWFTLSGEWDVFPAENYRKAAVTGTVCTKSYDFGTPESFKSVMGVAVQTAGAVTPAYATERTTYTDHRHTPDAGGLVRATPHIDRCRRLALRLSGVTGAVGAITLHLRGDMR